ncbi:MAG: response regulator [Deltaproteobacteria bacterium]|nr:response regulator [Deltaproteobacteria bacterium]
MDFVKQRPTVLVVDDEKMVLRALSRVLLSSEWDLATAESGAAALEILARQPIALIISDQRMPEMSGLELLNKVKELYPETVRIVLTGYAEMDVVVKAINQGEVYRFFTKPWNNTELIETVKTILSTWGEKKDQLSVFTDQLSRANLETVMALAEAIELKDYYTKGHCSRVRDYALRMALALNLSESFCRDLVYASLLHDCGKIGVSEATLNINGPLNGDQYREVQRHPVLGFEMTCKIEYLRPASIIIRQHHERWDGKGYPDHLKGLEISLGGRIVAVADTFDAMTSSRPYRRALGFKKAIQELLNNRGTQFDAGLVDLFVSLLVNESEAAGSREARRRLLLVGVTAEKVAELQRLLPSTGYELRAADTLAAARLLLEGVDMIICARLLQDGDGASFLTECRRLRPEIIRVMLIERQEIEALAETVTQAGLYAFMIRPLKPAEVLAMVENSFEWRRMAKALHFD